MIIVVLNYEESTSCTITSDNMNNLQNRQPVKQTQIVIKKNYNKIKILLSYSQRLIYLLKRVGFSISPNRIITIAQEERCHSDNVSLLKISFTCVSISDFFPPSKSNLISSRTDNSNLMSILIPRFIRHVLDRKQVE